MNFLSQTAWWTESFFGIESSEAFVLEIWGSQGDNVLANLAVDDIEISPGLCPGKKYSVSSSIYMSLSPKPCFLSRTSLKGWPGRGVSNFLCSGTPSQPTLSLACQLPAVHPLCWSVLLVVSWWHLLLQSCGHILSPQCRPHFQSYHVHIISEQHASPVQPFHSPHTALTVPPISKLMSHTCFHCLFHPTTCTSHTSQLPCTYL